MGIIYGLFDPRETTDLYDCRYVGLTTDPADVRLADHITLGYTDIHRHVYNWIRTLLADGVNPTMVVLQDDVDDEELDAAERSWIAAARYVNANLTNIRAGGRKGPASKRNLVTQTPRTIEDPIAYRNQRIREGHAKIDRTPTMCECGDGPFAGAQGVMRHATIKHNDRDEKWCECGNGPFIGNHGLNIHKRRCEATDESTWCVVCQEGPFDGLIGIRTHWSFKHSDNQEPLLCDQCGGGPFSGQHGLSGHLRQVHTGIEPTFCERGCGPFRGAAGLSNHLRYCGVNENLTCEECGCGPFTASSGLDTHKYRMHSVAGREPMVCECGQGPFIGSIGLSAHQRQSCLLSRLC